MAENRLLDAANLAGSAAGGTARGLLTVSHPRAVAIFTGLQPYDFDIFLDAENGLFERELNRRLKILSACRRSSLSRGRATKKTFEEIAEWGSGETAERTGSTPHSIRRVAKAIVCRAAVGVGKHLVRFVDLFELLLGLGVARIHVRVVRSSKLAVCLLQLVLSRRAAHTKDVIIVTLIGHMLWRPCFRSTEESAEDGAWRLGKPVLEIRLTQKYNGAECTVKRD
jgi:hypothetical protein